MMMERGYRMNSQCSNVDLILIKRFESISKIEKREQDEMLLVGKIHFNAHFWIIEKV
jgi:hypothetical protein